MDTVYKYCGKHGLAILRNLELLVRPPNQFNDPFEFTPRMFYSGPVRYFLPFPAEFIVSVTLGPKCCSELESAAREILLKSSFSRVELDRAILNKNDCTIEFERLKLKP